MATFEVRVEALTGLDISSSSNPTQTELTEYLEDGVLEVTNRLLSINPADVEVFTRESSEQTANGSLDLNGAKIISVVREDGVTSDNWRPCRKISPSEQHLVTDSASFSYASKFNPAYMVGDKGKISVFPAPGSDPNTFKVYYVNNEAVNSVGGTTHYSSSNLEYFPLDKVYLVILYAGQMSLLNAMAAKSDNLASDVQVPVLESYTQALPDSFVLPPPPSGADVDFSSIGSVETFSPPTFVAPSLGTISAMSLPAVPTTPTMAEKSVTITGTAPTYVAPVISLDSAPSITSLTIASAIPIPPTLDSTSIDTSGLTNPTFTPPVMNAPDWSDTNTWISTEEDSEMLSARVQESAGKVQEYSARMGEAQAKFAREHEILQKDLKVAMQNANTFEQGKLSKYGAELQSYQASVSSEVQEWQLDYTKQITIWESDKQSALKKYQADIQNNLNTFNKKNVEYQAILQKDLQDAQLKESKEARDLQKYSQEIQSYQSQVTKEVQRWNAEVFNRQFNEWQQKYQGQLNEYQANIEKEKSRVGASLQDFQAKVAKQLQKYQSETGYDVSIYQGQIQANGQKYQSDLAKYSSEAEKITASNQSNIGKFNSELQNYTNKINKDSVDYQWLQSRYVAIKQKYDEAFIPLAGAGKQQQRRK